MPGVRRVPAAGIACGGALLAASVALVVLEVRGGQEALRTYVAEVEGPCAGSR